MEIIKGKGKRLFVSGLSAIGVHSPAYNKSYLS